MRKNTLPDLKMSHGLLKSSLSCGLGFIQSTFCCIMLFFILLMMNNTIGLAKIANHFQQQSCCNERNLILTALLSSVKKYSAQKHVKNVYTKKNMSEQSVQFNSESLTDARVQSNKYSEWIQTPKQILLPLLDNPYIIQNSDICRRGKNLDVIVLIHSATRNFKRRQGIRNTWGNISNLKKINMRIIFLLGLTEDGNVQRKIVKENSKTKDIVQGNFIDTYQNLTHKAILGLRWLKDFCPEEKRVLKIDDDVFVNTEKLFSDFVHEYKNDQNSIHCTRQNANTSVIQRMDNDKWSVNKNEFRGLNYFPLTYCHGFFISMSTKMALKLLEAANDIPFFWIDDFFVYGMLADKAGVTSNIVDIHDILSLHTYNSLNCFGNENTQCNLLAGNAPNMDFMQLMWKKVLKQYRHISNTIVE